MTATKFDSQFDLLVAPWLLWLKKVLEPRSPQSPRKGNPGPGLALSCGLLFLGSACGGGGSSPSPQGPPPVAPVEILAALRATPGVASAQESASGLSDARFFVFTFQQPVDHRNPAGPSFPQTLTLLYRSATAPVVLATTGYDIPRSPAQGEPARILAANQLQVEHRYFSSSVPNPMDWRYLDIFQAASDHHRVVQAFRPLLTGRWLSAGGSKGGMASIFHRRFFPADVDATLAYVTPISFSEADMRYDAFVASRGTVASRAALVAWQQAILLDRRDEVGTLLAADAAQRGHTFNSLGLDRTLEFAVLEAPFFLWQDGDAVRASQVPPATDSANALYGFLNSIYSNYGGAEGRWSDACLTYFAPYYYQSACQLGNPSGVPRLQGVRYPEQDRPATYPPLGVTKIFDPAPMLDIQSWVNTSAEKILFIYGENDPWTAGAFEVPPAAQARDNRRYVVPGGNHGSHLSLLPEPQRSEAYTLLARWLGATVTPTATLTSQAQEHETYLRPRQLGVPVPAQK